MQACGGAQRPAPSPLLAYAPLLPPPTQDKMLRRATMHSAGQGVPTSDFTCPQCKSRACSYIDVGRRDIGKVRRLWGVVAALA